MRSGETAMPWARTARKLGREYGPALVGALLVGFGYLVDGSRSALVVPAGLIALASVAPRPLLLVLPATLGLTYRPLAIGLGSARLSPAELLILAVAIGVTARVGVRLVRRQGIWIHSLSDAAREVIHLRYAAVAAGLVVAGGVSLGTVADASHRWESLREFRWVVLEPVLVYALYTTFVRTTRDRTVALTAWLTSAAGLGLYSIVTGLAGGGLTVEGVTRIQGLHPHPNALALFLERPAALAAGMALVDAGRRRWMWSSLAIVTVAALLLTYSRGALLALGVALLAGGWLTRRTAVVTLGFLGGLLLVVLMAAIAPERALSLFAGGSGSLRLHIWESSLAMIRDYPIFGVGLDQFLYQYVPRYVVPEAWPERFTSHPHNLLLDFWLRLGLMGVALLACAVVQTIRYALDTRRTPTPIAVGLVLAVLVGGAHGLVDNGYFLPDLALAFWLAAAILDTEARDRHRSPVGRDTR